MTDNPITVRADESLSTAARRMRDGAVGAVIVVDGTEVRGVVTDRDIAVRAIAEDLDPRTLPTGELAGPDVIVTSADDDAETAVELMRTHSVRRLPVMDGEQVVGMVTLGDLAVARDGDSALADISSDAPNN
ncbi:CBS domain-containing protein [Catenuloplanes nepalensis]|uniref:CBS domain-containing protein n=1 Tax=Catenuloplanes nepalensis TaxID=587533 RepID=A0ABT9N8A2_9ACTN|nr:CBS domain-containing protein [Catenuloplanes nepalensis]MDP9799446.1 CBS domain-containing protein [Catenuloplanes nepalensis]